MIDFHKTMIRIHKKYEILKNGSVGFLWNDYQGLCYARFSFDEQIIVIVNNHSEDREISIELMQAGICRMGDTVLERILLSHKDGFTEAREEYVAKAAVLKVTMPGFGVMILHHKN